MIVSRPDISEPIAAMRCMSCATEFQYPHNALQTGAANCMPSYTWSDIPSSEPVTADRTKAVIGYGEQPATQLSLDYVPRLPISVIGLQTSVLSTSCLAFLSGDA